MMDPVDATAVEILPHGVVLTVPDGSGVRVVPLHWRDLTVEHADTLIVFSGPAGAYEWPPVPELVASKHDRTEDDYEAYEAALNENAALALAMYNAVMAAWYTWARESLGYAAPGDDAPDDDGPWIDDGFGSEWPARCPKCRDLTMEVVRPGTAQCVRCG